MAFRLLQGLKNRHLPRKETAYVFRDKDKVTLLMWYICSLIETLGFCFQSRGSSWVIIHKLWFIWTGKPIQTGCCKLFRNCVFKGFLACLTRRSPPNCYQFQVFSFSKHEKVWAAWNYQWRLRFFFFLFFSSPDSSISFWIWIHSQEAVFILLQVYSKVFYILQYHILKDLSLILEAFMHFSYE